MGTTKEERTQASEGELLSNMEKLSEKRLEAFAKEVREAQIRHKCTFRFQKTERGPLIIPVCLDPRQEVDPAVLVGPLQPNPE